MFAKTIVVVTALAASAMGAPTALEGRQLVGTEIAPVARYNYDVGTGAIHCNPAGGLVSKSTTNNGHDITTLVTFTYPAASLGKKCQLAFSLDATASLSGSQKIDVFTSLSPAPGCTTGWGPGNQRNNQLGRLSATLGAYATWEWTSSSYLTAPTDCKAPNTTEGFELVGVYDTDYVAWNGAVAACASSTPRCLASIASSPSVRRAPTGGTREGSERLPLGRDWTMTSYP